MADLGFRSYVKATNVLWCDVAVSFSEAGTNVANNTSSVFYSCTAQQRTDWGFSGTNRPNAGTVIVSVNGTDVRSFTIGLTNSPSRSSVSGTVSVPHNADGSKTVAISVRLENGSSDSWTYSPNSASGTMTLSNIPRASTPTLSASTASIGSAVTVYTNRATTSFTHSLWWSCGNSGWQSITTNIGDSVNWTIPNNVANYITNATSGTVTLLLRTFNGSNQIGSDKTVVFTAQVPNSFVPSMGSPTATRDNNGVPSSWGVYVKGYSKVTVAINGATGSYGSTITAYSITGAGISSDKSSAKSDVLTTAGTLTYTCTITDSRGRTATKTVAINVVDYTVPYIKVNAVRCDSSGNETSNGTSLRVTAEWNIASVSGKNSVSSRTVSCNGVSNTSFASGTAFVLNANCSIGRQYTLTASVTDALGKTATVTITVQTAERIINVRANKKGIAFGKFAENDEFEVGMDASYDGDLKVKHDLYGYRNFSFNGNWKSWESWSGDGKSDAYALLGTIKINSAYINCPIEICYTQRGNSTPVSLYMKFKSSSNTDPDIGTFWYDGDCLGAYICKTATSTWNIYITKSEPWDNIGIRYWSTGYLGDAITFTKSLKNVSSLPSGGYWARVATHAVADINNNSTIQFAYSKDGMSIDNMTWLACWNGYELRAMNKSQLVETTETGGWRYFKFFTGELIQYRKFARSCSFNTWGNIYTCDINTGLNEVPNYPVSFVDTPVRTVSITYPSNANALAVTPSISGYTDDVSKKNFGSFIISRGTNIATDFCFMLCAIGRWK